VKIIFRKFFYFSAMEIGNRKIVVRYIGLMLAGYTVWVGLYFLTSWIGELRGPAFDVMLTWDAEIPFLAGFQPVYVLCYVITFGVFFISTKLHFLHRAFLTLITANLFAFAFFALFPVQGPERTTFVSDGSVLHQVTALIYSVDSRYNALPSLHVANPWIVAVLAFSERGISFRSIVFFIIALAISLATLFVKQHFILDGIAGIVLAILSFIAIEKFHGSNVRS